LKLVSETVVPDAGSAQPEVTKPLMWITPGRVLYAGLLGRPSVRKMGGFILYVAQQQPIRVSIDGGPWQQGDLAVVPPYVPHRIASETRFIIDLIIEPETVQQDLLPAFLRSQQGVVLAPAFVARVRRVLDQWHLRCEAMAPDDAAFDQVLFGEPLPRTLLDPRIAQVLADIAQNPAGDSSAAQYAARFSLSFSRFVHLFKEQVGVPLRTLRMWKRARSMLDYVTQSANLADIAQITGYPDSSHFSHSIRQVFGLSPKDVFAGSRKLDLHGLPATATTKHRPKT
jgi:AraC-like DNA-binding protein